MCRAAANEFLCGFGRKKICGSAVGHYESSSGRKVARVSVTEGASETENSEKPQVAHSPSVAFGDSSLSEGAFVCACFFSAQKGKFLQIFRNYQKRFSESLRVDFCTDSVLSKQSLSRSATAPFAQGSHGLMRFLALCRRKSKHKIRTIKAGEIRTLFFCGTVAGHR